MPRTLLLLVLALEPALHGPDAIQAQEPDAPRLDRFGDPLPAGVLARLGTVRFHRCSCAAYSPDGKIIATADSDEVNLWDVATSKKIRRLPLEDRRSAVGLIFSHDGKKLAAIGWGGASVHVWDLNNFKKAHLVQADGGGCGGDWSHAAAFSSDDKTLFGRDLDNSVRLGRGFGKEAQGISLACHGQTDRFSNDRVLGGRQSRSHARRQEECISGTLRPASCGTKSSC